MFQPIIADDLIEVLSSTQPHRRGIVIQPSCG